MTDKNTILRNLDNVRSRILQASRRSSTAAESVDLIAVTKAVSADITAILTDMGAANLAENRAVEGVQKVNDLSALHKDENVTWHFIGHLQRNKVRRVISSFSWIHSIDSLKLLSAIDRVAGEINCRPCCLLEVNTSGEKAKHGLQPDDTAVFIKQAQEFKNVNLCGLMTMAPRSQEPESSRLFFRALRRIRDEDLREYHLPHLSMGMSADFEIAVEEGATMVRVGSSLFTDL